jgi:hypothetical protein
MEYQGPLRSPRCMRVALSLPKGSICVGSMSQMLGLRVIAKLALKVDVKVQRVKLACSRNWAARTALRWSDVRTFYFSAIAGGCG